MMYLYVKGRDHVNMTQKTKMDLILPVVKVEKVRDGAALEELRPSTLFPIIDN